MVRRPVGAGRRIRKIRPTARCIVSRAAASSSDAHVRGMRPRRAPEKTCRTSRVHTRGCAFGRGERRVANCPEIGIRVYFYQDVDDDVFESREVGHTGARR